jgi:hypothetical protein
MNRRELTSKKVLTANRAHASTEAKRPALDYQFTDLKSEEWGYLLPDTNRGGLILGKAVMKGKKPSEEGIVWTNFSNRYHAFLGRYSTTYSFGKELRTDAHSPTVNLRVMELARALSITCSEARRTSNQRKSVLSKLSMPPGGFTVANATKYKRGDHLGWHTDNEPQHGYAGIASVSFGAPAIFKFGADAKERTKAVVLEDGDLIFFDRNTYHSISHVEGPRTNYTFRYWNDFPYWERDTKLFQQPRENRQKRQRDPPHGQGNRSSEANKRANGKQDSPI